MTLRDLLVATRDATLVAVLAVAAAAATNALRDAPFPWIAVAAYDLFVPCPEPLGDAKAVSPMEPIVRAERTLVVDARDRAAHSDWHLSGAMHVPFDWIDAVPDEAVRRVAASGAAAVVVYGDGGDPDSGRELARELSGRGVRNVHYVEGGAPALRGDGHPPGAGEVAP
jgi:rhodanese-related sulfurtransferase